MVSYGSDFISLSKVLSHSFESSLPLPYTKNNQMHVEAIYVASKIEGKNKLKRSSISTHVQYTVEMILEPLILHVECRHKCIHLCPDLIRFSMENN